jgi:hypothetical protein
MSTHRLNELPVPPSSQMSEKASEVLRVWINADRNMDVTLRSAFADPAAWGILLVDIARHVSRAYEQDGEHSMESALNRIRDGFDAEWNHATDPGTTDKLHEQ